MNLFRWNQPHKIEMKMQVHKREREKEGKKANNNKWEMKILQFKEKPKTNGTFEIGMLRVEVYEERKKFM